MGGGHNGPLPTWFMTLITATQHDLHDPAAMEKIIRGSAQHGLEPDYEVLKRHIELWIAKNPEETQRFLEYRRKKRSENLNEFGSDEKGLVRETAALPPGLFNIIMVLAPNFFGAQEITPESKKKRLRKSLKQFPMFQTCEKL